MVGYRPTNAVANTLARGFKPVLDRFLSEVIQVLHHRQYLMNCPAWMHMVNFALLDIVVNAIASNPLHPSFQKLGLSFFKPSAVVDGLINSS